MKNRRTLFGVALLASLLFQAPALPAAAAGSLQAGTVSTNFGALNVRSAPGTDSSILASLPKGSLVTLTERSGSWWRVQYADGKYGYCHASYLSPTDSRPSYVSTDTGRLNVRSAPGTSAFVLTSLPKHTSVLVLSEANGWSRILYGGTKTGYVRSSYLSASGGAESKSAVLLKLPDFKQTDSRWASVPLGSFGKTIGQIGCTTTALAMMESYRTGKTVYPDAMSRTLSYAADGSLYWPQHYQLSTDSEALLSRILQQLKAGKPVLVGAKNSAGTQHWVVVTGFRGGSLTAENFVIHDPGSHTRTTLAQFFLSYPSFYKLGYWK